MEEKNVRIRFIVKPRRIKSVKNSSKLLLLLGIFSVGIPNKTSTVLYKNLAISEEAKKKQEQNRVLRRRRQKQSSGARAIFPQEEQNQQNRAQRNLKISEMSFKRDKAQRYVLCCVLINS